ncbi:MAG: hypothetical protein HDT37_05210 [Clostridiales bacterium]|nr:hypothetical protein [Clostridiales bacterium]
MVRFIPSLKLGEGKMTPISNQVSYLPYDDYAQSANTLFHFMKEPEYLNAILRRRALVPRYCVETIDYLNIHKGTRAFNEAAILQKCFCDIPFHKLADTFSVNGVGEVYDSLSKDERAELEKNNTHFAYYGEYAIAFSKSWGERKNLQPVHYLNKDSQYAKDFSALFERVFRDDDIPDEYSQDVINRLAYIKPLRGIMQRKIILHSDSNSATVNIYKNFHDEREWRYVPNADILSSLKTESIIANPYIIPLANEISDGLENERYKALWLNFSYDDIRYIIVPNILARIDTIKTITELPNSCFEDQNDISMQKSVLISKILVLAEIRKDW